MSKEKKAAYVKGFIQLQVLELWEGLGNAQCFETTIDNRFKRDVEEKLEEAKRVRWERRRNRSRRAVIESLRGRGIDVVDGLLGYDENDLVGLVGEIAVENLIIAENLELILPKWRYTGTSKSKGIDLVARERLGDRWQLALYEAKHVHAAIRNAEPRLSHNIIRHKFKTGINEFEHDKTMLNLANVIIKLGDFIRVGKANGSDVSLAKEHRDSVSLCLSNDQYRVSAVVLVDSKYCDDETLQRSVLEMPHPLEIGENHFVTLELLKASEVEQATDEVGEHFVGAV